MYKCGELIDNHSSETTETEDEENFLTASNNISDFLALDSENFKEKYDRNELYAKMMFLILPQYDLLETHIYKKILMRSRKSNQKSGWKHRMEVRKSIVGIS